MRQLQELCCQNNDCPEHGKRNGKNLRWHGWSGKKEKGIRLVFCKSCGTYFSERKGTALYQSRLSQSKAVEVLSHVVEGNGVRSTSRLTGVNRSTISRLTKIAGEHAAALHDELVAFSPSHRRGTV